MRTCSKCSFENGDDTDFCEKCGTYLRWEPTRVVAAVPAPPAAERPSPAEPADLATVAGSAPAPAEPTPAEPTPAEPRRATVTLQLPAVSPGAATHAGGRTSAVAGVQPEPVLVALRLAEATDGAGGEVTATAAPGGQATLVALIRNQSGIVDNYDVEVAGVPPEWWTATPPTVYLVPFGAPAGQSEQDVEIRFHPPRSAQAEARSWPITVQARSKAHGAVSGSATATLVITPFEELDSELRPEVASGRRSATFALAVRNSANAPIETFVSATDAEGVCTFEFAEPRFVAEPGRRAGTTFTVRTRKPIWVGRTTDRRFEVVARGVGTDAATRPHQAVFRQRPYVPWWVIPIVPLLVAAAVLALTLIPHNKTVPDLRGKTPAQAEALLGDAGLKLSPEVPKERRAPSVAAGAIVSQVPKAGKKVKKGSLVTVVVAEPRVPKLLGKTQSQARLILDQAGLRLAASPPEKKVSKAAVGTIVGQIPGAGRSVASGTEVSIQIAVGTGARTVPNLVGMSLTAADGTLRKAGLTIVLPVLPPGLTPDKATVQGQLPAAGTQVKANEAVTVYIKQPPPPKVKVPTVVPTLAGLTEAAAAAALSRLHVVPQETRRFDVSKPGTIIEQIPPAGQTIKPGGSLTLVVSAGYPRIAFSDGKNLKLMGGGTGAGVTTLTRTADAEDEPAWQPGGRLIAYRRGPSGDPRAGRIWVVDPADPSSARALTAGPDDRRPAFSPDGKVIAFVRRNPGPSGTGTDQDLCFVRVDTPGRAGACIGDTALSVDRPAWSPDGRSILAVAVDPADQSQTELVEYTSERPDSSQPSSWQKEGLVTNGFHGQRPGEGVLFAAFAPDGKQVALVANWGSKDLSFFHVFLSQWSGGALGPPKAVVPQIRACEVAWRSDSGELAVTRADDCTAGSGAIARVDPAKPGQEVTLRQLDGQNPAWEPVVLTG